jgi:hypothetical protein
MAKTPPTVNTVTNSQQMQNHVTSSNWHDSDEDDDFQPDIACIKRTRDDCSLVVTPAGELLQKGKQKATTTDVQASIPDSCMSLSVELTTFRNLPPPHTDTHASISSATARLSLSPFTGDLPLETSLMAMPQQQAAQLDDSHLRQSSNSPSQDSVSYEPAPQEAERIVIGHSNDSDMDVPLEILVHHLFIPCSLQLLIPTHLRDNRHP